jgi:D-sedoheptulose 7-phosphate isomerase
VKTSHEIIRHELDEHLLLLTTISQDEQLISRISDIASTIVQSVRDGGKILIFGCGGSAADSQHIAAEFINRLKRDRRCIPALALTTDTSVLTAIGNDSNFDLVFSRQVEGLARSEDVVIGISTSGTSPVVLNGLAAARTTRARTIFLTSTKNRLETTLADHILQIPGSSTVRIQEAHITISHIICELVEAELYG